MTDEGDLDLSGLGNDAKILVYLTRIDGRISAHAESMRVQVDSIKQTVEFGDRQNATAIALLHDKVSTLEANQVRIENQVGKNANIPERVAALDVSLTDVNTRLRKLEDVLTGFRAVTVTAGVIGGALGAGGIVGLIKLIGG